MQPARIVFPGDRPAGNTRGTRSVVMARHGMVATSQPLASAAGLDVLCDGGNAVDAAVTAAAVLAVVEPTMTGIGGDLFALVYDARDGRLRGLNASGRTGARAACAAFAGRGLDRIPARGPLSVTVPGAVDGWAELLARFGTISLGRALAPAIVYARDGFPVAEIVAGQWLAAEAALRESPEAASVFLPAGRAPRPGEMFANPALAASLELIAGAGRDAFYHGPLAASLCSHLAAGGGLVGEEDFAAERADWVEPLHASFYGSEVYELPPNTQGFVALEMLNILEGWDLPALGHNSAEYLHLLVEAKRVAFADRDRVLADADEVPAAVLARLVSKEYAASRRAGIDPGRVAREETPEGPGPAATGAGDTVYLAAADGAGNVVSLIQSIFEPFGSAVVPPGTGVVLQNRGSLFSLDERRPSRLAPRRRPPHTLIPAMAFRGGRPFLTFGVMGGDMQPQGHVQVLANLLAFGMTIQEAGEAARVRHSPAGVAVESGVSATARSGLEARGHRVIDTPGVFGGFQGIAIDPATGVLLGGSDPRKDGMAIGY